jgi:hypothetical protein
MRLSIIKRSLKNAKGQENTTLAEGTRVYEACGFVGSVKVRILIFDYNEKRISVDCYHSEHNYSLRASSQDIADVDLSTSVHCFRGNEFEVHIINVTKTFVTTVRTILNEWDLELPFHKEYEDQQGTIWKNVYARKERKGDLSPEKIVDRKLNTIVDVYSEDFIYFDNE